MTNEIEYKGATLFVKTDFSVIAKVCSKFNIKLTEFSDCIQIPEQFIFLFGESLKRGMSIEKQKFDYQEQQIEDILSDNYAEFMEHFNTDCLRLATKKTDLQTNEPAKKKK